MKAVYAKDYRTWWMYLQPEWRKEGDVWPMKRDVPDGEQWREIVKGGKNGFYLLLVGLCWWKTMADEVDDGTELRGELDSVVEDVRWVLEKIDEGMASGRIEGPDQTVAGKKRAADDDETNQRKRQ